MSDYFESEDDFDYDDEEEYEEMYERRNRAQDVNFPNNEIRDKIREYNTILKNGAVGQDATYRIELMQDCLVDPQQHTMFHLRLIRTERVPQTLLDKDPRTSGAVQLICRFVLHIPRNRTLVHEFERVADYSIIHTMAAATALNDPSKYFAKKYARLIIHVMIFCVASARKCVAVDAVHEATARTFRMYDRFSKYDFDTWEIKHPGIDIDTVDTQKVEDECRLINASRYDYPREISTSQSDHQQDVRQLEDEEVENLKNFADKNTLELLDMMTKENSFYLSTPSNVYFI